MGGSQVTLNTTTGPQTKFLYYAQYETFCFFISFRAVDKGGFAEAMIHFSPIPVTEAATGSPL